MSETTVVPQCPSCGEKELTVGSNLAVRIHADESWDFQTPFLFDDEDHTTCMECGWVGAYKQFVTAAERPLLLTIHCTQCNGRIELQVRAEGWTEWFTPERRNVQEVFPYLTAAEREMFLSQICGDCFKKTDDTPDEIAADTIENYLDVLDVNSEYGPSAEIVAAMERAVIALRHHPLPENCEACFDDEQLRKAGLGDEQETKPQGSK